MHSRASTKVKTKSRDLSSYASWILQKERKVAFCGNFSVTQTLQTSGSFWFQCNFLTGVTSYIYHFTLQKAYILSYKYLITYHLQKVHCFYIFAMVDRQRKLFDFRLSWMAGRPPQIPKIQLKITKQIIKQIEQIINFFILLVSALAFFTPSLFSFLQCRKRHFRINENSPKGY